MSSNRPEYLFTYHHQRPALGVDLVLMSVLSNDDISVALIKRGHDPYKGFSALPGGHVDPGPTGLGERLVDTCVRETREEIGIHIDPKDLTFMGIYDEPGRDPRGWRVSACYYKELHNIRPILVAGDDASVAWWQNILDLPSIHNIAFDHQLMIAKILKDWECFQDIFPTEKYLELIKWIHKSL